MLENRPYILITGASSGVGRATAILLSDKYNLVIHGRNQNRLLETKSMCSSNSDIKLWQFDFSFVDGIETSLQELLLRENIMVYSFIHSAGTVVTLPLRALSTDKIQYAMNTNFLSASIISRLLAQKKYNGTELKNIVFISSNISNRGAKAFAAYAASKGALDAFMRCLAVELAPRVRVNSILPGSMLTEMTSQIFQDQELIDKMENSYPLGLGKPQDIAPVIRFLISDNARWITGQQITADGGRVINLTA